MRKVLTCHFNSQGRGIKSQFLEKKSKINQKNNQNIFLGSPRKTVYMVIITNVTELCWEDGEGRWVWSRGGGGDVVDVSSEVLRLRTVSG